MNEKLHFGGKPAILFLWKEEIGSMIKNISSGTCGNILSMVVLCDHDYFGRLRERT